LAIRDDEDNLKIDQLTGKVYIPGSSVAGAFRNYYEIILIRIPMRILMNCLAAKKQE